MIIYYLHKGIEQLFVTLYRRMHQDYFWLANQNTRSMLNYMLQSKNP